MSQYLYMCIWLGLTYQSILFTICCRIVSIGSTDGSEEVHELFGCLGLTRTTLRYHKINEGRVRLND